ncbi:MAG: hypothetical protein U0414_27225 [Polyangiaceae bacterium]
MRYTRGTVRVRLALVASIALPACGARTSLREDAEAVASTAEASSSASSGEGGCSPTTLEADSPGVEFLVAEGEQVFYVTRDHRVMAANLDTAEATLLTATSPMALAGAVTAFGDFVYYADDNVVWRVSKAGGAPEALTEKIPQLFNLTADASGLYWTQGGGPVAARDIIRRRPDGTRITIASQQHGVFGILPLPEGIVFSTQSDDSGVFLASPDGGAVTAIVTGLPQPRYPFAHGGWIHWVEETDVDKQGFGAVARAKLDGSGYERVLVEGDPAIVTTRAVTDGVHTFAVRVAANYSVVAADYPVATDVVTVRESPFPISALSLTLTPKRLVFTFTEPSGEPSIESVCLADL